MRFALPPIRLRLLLPLAIAATATVAVVFMGEGSAQTASQREVIATATSNGFRVTVTAIRQDAPGNNPDTATVRIAAFKRSGGEWDRLGNALTVGSPSSWFWNVVTRPYGVRQLTLALPGGTFPERVGLRLLISPAIGSSGTFRFVVDQGELVAVDV